MLCNTSGAHFTTGTRIVFEVSVEFKHRVNVLVIARKIFNKTPLNKI